MSRCKKVALALCACVVVIALGSGSAAASIERLLLSAPGEVTLASVGKISFTASAVVVRCNLSMTGSFQSAIIPRAGETIASISRVSASGCEGGEGASVTVLSLPWSLTYSSVSGSEPEALTGVLGTLNNVSVSIRSGALTCLYRGSVGHRIALSGTNPYRVGTVSTLANSLALVSGAGCSRTASMSGSYTVSRTEWISEIPSGLPLHPSTPQFSRSLAPNEIKFQNIDIIEVETGAVGYSVTGWNPSDLSGCSIRKLAVNQECPIEIGAEANAPAGLLRVFDRNTGARIGVLPLITP